jgi:signal transduction histidine kinase
MNRHKEQLGAIAGFGLAGLVLAVLLFYTVVRFSEHPYLGFRLDTTGRITRVYVGDKTLKAGDLLVQIDDLRWGEFMADLRKPLSAHLERGQVVNLRIERIEQDHHILKDISWVLPGRNSGELYNLVVNQVWLAYIFWLAGFLTFLYMRPKDERWRLMMAFNYLTAIWIVAGGDISFYHLRESAIVLHMAIWLCVPVYLQLNWVFPKPLSQLPWPVVWGCYILAAGFSLVEWFQILKPNFYYVGFFLAIIGSVILLFIHALRQPEARRDLRILITFVMLALLPPVIFGIISIFGGDALVYGGAAILSLPLFPFGYLIATYRRLLGDLEMRVSILLSAWLFLILAGMFVLPLILWINTSTDRSEITSLANLAITFFAIVVTMFGFIPFQTFVRRHLMGIRLMPDQLQETYAARITTSTSSLALHKLIEGELIPSLLVRQFLFLQFSDNGPSKVLFAVGITEEQYPREEDIPILMGAEGKYRSFARMMGKQPYLWVRLVLSLKVGDKLTGLWLFGRRDPDDLYPEMDILKLQSLADQTAIAQSNLFQTERLKMLYLANIDRHEDERLRLARELHESILGQVAALKISLKSPLPQDFQENYEKLTTDIREIASDLRPPMLIYGLRLAIRGLADSLTGRSKDGVLITAEIQSQDVRYDPHVELYLFRIVQEACENALRHAKARKITIFGRLEPGEIDLIVQDDGVGFQSDGGFSLENLLANKHFGLVGMMERAELIGAKFSVQPVMSAGTQIHVIWTKQNNDIS